MRLLLFFLFGFLTFGVVNARQADAGEALFKSKQYAKAKIIYEGLLKQRPSDQNFNFRYGVCCFEAKEYDLAIKHFSSVNVRYPMRELYLARCYYQTYRFAESVKAYEEYAGLSKSSTDQVADLEKEKNRALMAAEMISHVDDVAIVDSLQLDKSDFLKFYKKAAELGSLQADQIKLQGKRNVDRVKYCTQRGDRMLYSDSIHGHMNLYSKYKLLDAWSDPVALPSIINTQANENYPFLLLDGITVYFASDGDKSLGGYDIFVTRFAPGNNTYLEPENIGFPFNSTANDYMMVIDDQHHYGWFATDREQPEGKVMIYTFIPNQVRKPLKTQDENSIINAARLKSYRKEVLSQNQKSGNVVVPQKESEDVVKFVVNDSLIYTSVDQFHSEKAKDGWKELLKLHEALKEKTDSLTEMRVRYGESSGEDEKKELISKILELEQKNIELKRNIQLKSNQIRIEELKSLH